MTEVHDPCGPIPRLSGRTHLRYDRRSPPAPSRGIPMISVITLTAILRRFVHELAAPRGHYRPLRVGDAIAGWIGDARARRLAAMPEVFEVRDDGLRFVPSLASVSERSAALEAVARVLAAEGALSAWRDERYAVAAAFGAAPWFVLERAAARYFGIRTYAAHVNGLVRHAAGLSMWLARRSFVKAIDPGMLDNLVGGGIAAGHTVAETVVKESWEEAGIDELVARTAEGVGALDICREQPDGLQRETIFVHDLWLPENFVPAGRDGEVIDHRRVSCDDTASLIAISEGPDVVTADASLVILDFLFRQRMITEDEDCYRELDSLRRRVDTFATSF